MVDSRQTNINPMSDFDRGSVSVDQSVIGLPDPHPGTLLSWGQEHHRPSIFFRVKDLGYGGGLGKVEEPRVVNIVQA